MQEVGFKEAFWPLYGMDEAEPITWTNIGLRGSFALLASGICWLLYANSPDKGTAVEVLLLMYQACNPVYLSCSIECLLLNLSCMLICVQQSVSCWGSLELFYCCPGQIGDGARGARGSILDLLGLHDPAQLSLGHGGKDTNQTSRKASFDRSGPNLQHSNL